MQSVFIVHIWVGLNVCMKKENRKKSGIIHSNIHDSALFSAVRDSHILPILGIMKVQP